MMLHQRNLKTLSLGRDKKVQADTLFQVFRPSEKDGKKPQGYQQQSTGPKTATSNCHVAEARNSSSDQNGPEEGEALGFMTDTKPDPAVVQEMQKSQPSKPTLTKEEAEMTWRVEGSSRAGFKVFRRVKQEDVPSEGSEQSRQRRSKRRRRTRTEGS
eukprot:symbB.v1.2.039511.t1/scaffold6616.1/size16691/2